MFSGFMNGLAAIAGPIMSMFKGGSSNIAQQAPAVAQGVQSMMGQTTPGPMVESPSGGSKYVDKLLGGVMSSMQDGMSQALGDAASNFLSPRKDASDIGRDQRSMMDAAYPELNAWEKAGASAVQQGMEMAKNETAEKLMSRKMAHEKTLQSKALDVERERINMQGQVAGVQSATQIKATEMNNRASRYSADTAIRPAMSRVEMQNYKDKLEAELAHVRKYSERGSGRLRYAQANDIERQETERAIENLALMVYDAQSEFGNSSNIAKFGSDQMKADETTNRLAGYLVANAAALGLGALKFGGAIGIAKKLLKSGKFKVKPPDFNGVGSATKGGGSVNWPQTQNQIPVQPRVITQ